MPCMGKGPPNPKFCGKLPALEGVGVAPHDLGVGVGVEGQALAASAWAWTSFLCSPPLPMNTPYGGMAAAVLVHGVGA